MEEPLKPSQDDALKSTLREQEIEIVGQKEMVGTYKKQFQELAELLGTQTDYAVIKSEVMKLILLEDDNIALKSQLREIKDSEGRAVGKVFVKMKKEVDKYKESVDGLVDNVQFLKSRRNVDKYQASELMKEAVKKWFRNTFSFIPNTGQKVSQFVSLRILRKKRG